MSGLNISKNSEISIIKNQNIKDNTYKYNITQ